MANTNNDSQPLTIGEVADRVTDLNETDILNLQDILKDACDKLTSLQKQFKKCESNIKKSKSIVDELTLASKNLHSFSSRYTPHVSWYIKHLGDIVSFYDNELSKVSDNLSMYYSKGDKYISLLEELKGKSFKFIKKDFLEIIDNNKSISDDYNDELSSSYWHKNIKQLICDVTNVELLIRDKIVKGIDRFLRGLESDPIDQRKYLSSLLSDYREQCAEEEKQKQDTNKGDSSTVVGEAKDTEKVSCETTMSNRCNADELESDPENITWIFERF